MSKASDFVKLADKYSSDRPKFSCTGPSGESISARVDDNGLLRTNIRVLFSAEDALVFARWIAATFEEREIDDVKD